MENCDFVGVYYVELKSADFIDLHRRVRKLHIHGIRLGKNPMASRRQSSKNSKSLIHGDQSRKILQSQEGRVLKVQNLNALLFWKFLIILDFCFSIFEMFQLVFTKREISPMRICGSFVAPTS